jgi:hypothetical protein
MSLFLFALGALQHGVAVLMARAVQRDSLLLHGAAVFSSVSVWWFLIREVVLVATGPGSGPAFASFVTGCVAGSLTGKVVSRRLERRAGSEVK